jgi:hypothetical protein
MPWRELEKNVREVAEKLWNRSAQSKVLCGVQIDCVVEIQADYVCLVEVTEEYDLQKVRNDITKLDTVSHGLLAQNIYSKKFIVLKKIPQNRCARRGTQCRLRSFRIRLLKKCGLIITIIFIGVKDARLVAL